MSSNTMTGAAARVLRSPGTPLAIWWACFGTATAVSVERLFGELSPAALQFAAKLNTYVGAATSATLAAGMLIAFALSCGAILRWLGVGVGARAVARAVCLGTWSFAAYTGSVAVGLLATPPRALRREELTDPVFAESHLEGLLGLPWLTETQVVSGVLFLGLVFFALRSRTGAGNAAIAVGFGTSVVVFAGAALRTLAASFPLH